MIQRLPRTTLRGLAGTKNLNERLITRFEIEPDDFSFAREIEYFLHPERAAVEVAGLLKIAHLQTDVRQRFDAHHATLVSLLSTVRFCRVEANLLRLSLNPFGSYLHLDCKDAQIVADTHGRFDVDLDRVSYCSIRDPNRPSGDFVFISDNHDHGRDLARIPRLALPNRVVIINT